MRFHVIEVRTAPAAGKRPARVTATSGVHSDFQVLPRSVEYDATAVASAAFRVAKKIKPSGPQPGRRGDFLHPVWTSSAMSGERLTVYIFEEGQ